MPLKKSNKYCAVVLNFYRTHLKSNPIIHGACVRIYFRLFPVISSVYYFIARNANRKKYRIKKISKLVFSEKFQSQIILPEQRYTVTCPNVYPTQHLSKFDVGETFKVFPEILITTIPNAKVIGGSNIVFTQDYAIKHDLIDLPRDYLSEELHRRYYVSLKSGFLTRYTPVVSRKTFQQAACFTDACSGNYAHWLTEVLPRIYLFTESGMSPDIRMIIDRGLHPNLMESFHVVAGKNPNVFKLGKNRLVSVEKLSLVSCAGYVPFGRRNGKTKGHSHGRFSPATFKGMVNKIRQNLSVEVKDGWRKLYIRRNSSVRTVSNLQDIEQVLMLHGFEFIEPEVLTFAEQVKLFSEAGVIVGATGAAMANLIFCGSSTKIIVMMGIHDEMPYAYWQNMAQAVGNEVNYVLGRISDLRFKGIHGNFRIEICDLLKAIESSTVV